MMRRECESILFNNAASILVAVEVSACARAVTAEGSRIRAGR
ncbi:hypothetical protein [Streptomyces sp. 1331.2]|nr:hypothetical protein [Streptomyces sp. 1331.2]SOB88766.1 hypothetical protein SAMN06272789_7072 [Streptomyces sp. 1331.2]SOB88771.1 hypothetical protein SAMN06272789_7078 [Streptomyces sp. 1331.2]